MNDDIKLVSIDRCGGIVALVEIEPINKLLGVKLKQLRDIPAEELIDKVASFIHDENTGSISFKINEFSDIERNDKYSRIYISKDLITDDCIDYDLNRGQFDTIEKKVSSGCAVSVRYCASNVTNIQTIKLGIYKSPRNFVKAVFGESYKETDGDTLELKLELDKFI